MIHLIEYHLNFRFLISISNNLEFLIRASEEEFEQWCQRATPDDYDYALGLFKAKRAYDLMNQLDKPIFDLTDAKSVINKFTLKE